MTVIAFALFLLFVGAATALWLTYKGYADQDAAPGWISATMCIIASLMIFAGYIGEHGIGVPDDNARQIATLVSVVATLCAVAGVAVWRMRNRPRAPQGATRTNYVSGATHAYGSYTPADIRAARAKAQQARQGARNG